MLEFMYPDPSSLTCVFARKQLACERARPCFLPLQPPRPALCKSREATVQQRLELREIAKSERAKGRATEWDPGDCEACCWAWAIPNSPAPLSLESAPGIHASQPISEPPAISREGDRWLGGRDSSPGYPAQKAHA